MSTSSSPATHDGDTFVCECEEGMRSACRGEGFYKERGGKRYCVLHYPGTEKKADFAAALQRKLDADDFDFRGVWFPDHVNFSRRTFSVAVSFASAQFCASASFYGAQFYAVTDFSNARFNDDADFQDAQFNGIVYILKTHFSEDAFFFGAQFRADAYLGAQYSGAAVFGYTLFLAAAYFGGTQFTGTAYFRGAQFHGDVIFSNSIFNATVNFLGTKFLTGDSYRGDIRFENELATVAGDAPRADAKTVRVRFDGAIFKDVISFKENVFAEPVTVSFDAAVFEKPERAVFHTTPLRPHWFINVDSRKFNFINVVWRFLGKPDAIERERAALEIRGEHHVSRLLEVTFRQLAVNAEENNRYEEAADFRYMAMEVRRQQGGRKVDPFRLSWWYWLLSGYGERVRRAFVALLTIWLLFAVIYWAGDATWWQPRQSSRLAADGRAREQQSPDEAAKQQPGVAAQQSVVAAPLTLPESLIYSAGVMSLQKPEPPPANKRAKASVLFETILGPLQAALLALAIRRKFMR